MNSTGWRWLSEDEHEEAQACSHSRAICGGGCGAGLALLPLADVRLVHVGGWRARKEEKEEDKQELDDYKDAD